MQVLQRDLRLRHGAVFRRFPFLERPGSIRRYDIFVFPSSLRPQGHVTSAKYVQGPLNATNIGSIFSHFLRDTTHNDET